jgi:hypothetical protein
LTGFSKEEIGANPVELVSEYTNKEDLKKMIVLNGNI